MNKRRLYERIMTSVSKEVKRVLNELTYSLSIDDNDFEDDLDVRHEDDTDFKGDKFRYSIIMRDYIEKLRGFYNLNKEDYVYIESLYDKYGALYKVKNRAELNLIVKNYKRMNKHLNWLDVSNVTDMSYLFYDNDFNLNISDWDVSNVTDMHGMFYDAKNFNQPIGGWNVSNVTDMRYMFYNAWKLNHSIERWDISSTTDTSAMFYRCPLSLSYAKRKYLNGNHE